MPFVYSLSLLAQNHYMLKPAKPPISLYPSLPIIQIIYKYKTVLLAELPVFIIYQGHKPENTTCLHGSDFMA